MTIADVGYKNVTRERVGRHVVFLWRGDAEGGGEVKQICRGVETHSADIKRDKSLVKSKALLYNHAILKVVANNC